MRHLGQAFALGLLIATITALGQAQAISVGEEKRNDNPAPFTGLANTPEANLFVGGSTTSIPIEVPPGRKSLTPKLALTYSSSGGPSPYGYGWDLPLGRIQRSTKHGVYSCTDPTYHNDFVLVLPGATVECTLNGNLCKATAEESFLRIEYVSSGNYWQVWDKSGLRYTFGDQSRVKPIPS